MRDGPRPPYPGRVTLAAHRRSSAPGPGGGQAEKAGFGIREWALLGAAAALWGSSFLFIKIGVGHYPPATVAWLRLLFGVALLSCFPSARHQLRHRRDRGPVALLGLVWMAVPFVLFPFAEQTVPSALAGMINGATPLFTAVIAAIVSRQLPSRGLRVGLGVGFVGVVAVTAPAAGRGTSDLVGVGLLLLAAALYGVAYNLTGRLQQRNGALTVVWQAELFSLVVLTPFGLPALLQTPPSLSALLALVALGALGTGLAYAAFALLVDRVGAARGSISTYLVPVVAIALGGLVGGETIHLVSLVGIALVLVGAFLTSRARSV